MNYFLKLAKLTTLLVLLGSKAVFSLDYQPDFARPPIADKELVDEAINLVKEGIRSINDFYPNNLKNRSNTFSSWGEDGLSPLHVAILENAPVEILEILLADRHAITLPVLSHAKESYISLNALQLSIVSKNDVAIDLILERYGLKFEPYYDVFDKSNKFTYSAHDPLKKDFLGNPFKKTVGQLDLNLMDLVAETGNFYALEKLMDFHTKYPDKIDVDLAYYLPYFSCLKTSVSSYLEFEKCFFETKKFWKKLDANGFSPGYKYLSFDAWSDTAFEQSGLYSREFFYRYENIYQSFVSSDEAHVKLLSCLNQTIRDIEYNTKGYDCTGSLIKGLASLGFNFTSKVAPAVQEKYLNGEIELGALLPSYNRFPAEINVTYVDLINKIPDPLLKFRVKKYIQ